MNTEKRVLVIGCFDVLHIGHVRFLQTARSYGDRLIVLIESDEYIRTYKKREPFHSATERAEILAALVCVDDVVVATHVCHTKEEYLERWRQIHPDIVVITQGDPYANEKKEQALKIGAICVEVSHILDRSTSNILEGNSLSKEILD